LIWPEAAVRVIVMTRTRLAALVGAALLGAVLLAGASAGAATNDRPSTGHFEGSHFFDGPVKLTFRRADGIGLYLHRYVVRGTFRCGDEEIPIDYAGRVTARTAAKVKRKRFRLSIAGMRLNGRYDSSKRLSGTIELILSSSACTPKGGFSASRRKG
jgi:hypothetical protein